MRYGKQKLGYSNYEDYLHIFSIWILFLSQSFVAKNIYSMFDNANFYANKKNGYKNKNINLFVYFLVKNSFKI